MFYTYYRWSHGEIETAKTTQMQTPVECTGNRYESSVAYHRDWLRRRRPSALDKNLIDARHYKYFNTFCSHHSVIIPALFLPFLVNTNVQRLRIQLHA